MEDKQRNAWEAYTPTRLPQDEVITMPNRTEKQQYENKEQDKTQHDMPRSKKHKADMGSVTLKYKYLNYNCIAQTHN